MLGWRSANQQREVELNPEKWKPCWGIVSRLYPWVPGKVAANEYAVLMSDRCVHVSIPCPKPCFFVTSAVFVCLYVLHNTKHYFYTGDNGKDFHFLSILSYCCIRVCMYIYTFFFLKPSLRICLAIHQKQLGKVL